MSQYRNQIESIKLNGEICINTKADIYICIETEF